MAANPNPKQTPLHALFGQRARPTIPMARDERDELTPPVALRAIGPKTEIVTVDRCRRCGGTGTLEGLQTVCNVCRKTWWQEDVEAEGRRLIRGTLLPCGHVTVTREPFYTPPNCPGCWKSPWGKGRLEHRVTIEELVPVLLRLIDKHIEQRIDRIAQEITARLRALD